MKPYPLLPACKGSTCNQGRSQCKTEALCRIDLHRYPPPITADGGRTVEFEEARSRPLQITMEEDDTALCWALLIVAGCFVAGIVALPFIFGAM